MKKLFTLLMVLAVATMGYAQTKTVSRRDAGKPAKMQVVPRNEGAVTLEHVSSQPNMMKDGYEDWELDYTWYDWQTNAAARTWTHVWEDGKVNFAFTMSVESGYPDRGTAIGTYDHATGTWMPSGGRLESEKTGFGTIARYGENGLVIAAHTSSECGVYIVEDKDNLTPESAITMEKLDPTHDPCWPNVMTSGPNRDIIHVVATCYTPDFDGPMEDVNQPIIYFRSTDGGQSWDKENVVLPYMDQDYCLDWGSNVCYWMETTEDNCLALVINNAWSDGFVLYSYDDGETWEKKMFYKHPNIQGGFDSTLFTYPRWVSAQWDSNHKLHIAYEWNGATENPGSGSYYPSMGGVAYWNEDLPYHGCDTMSEPSTDNVVGEPFILTDDYIYYDLYGSWWLMQGRLHAPWPEYIGPLVPLDDEGNPEDPEEHLAGPYIDPEVADTAYLNTFNISDRSKHGHFNNGICGFPVLCMVPGSDDMVAVWSMMDENNVHTASTNFPFKLYCRYSADGGLTWSRMKALTNDVELRRYEAVYPQAAVVEHTLVVAAQLDTYPGSYVIGSDGDIDPEDNYYQGFIFDLDQLFPEMGVSVPEVQQATKMTICPNPAVDHLNVTLNTNAEIVIYNIMGQMVSSQKGHAGLNTVEVSSLSSGVYFINAGSDTQKFVVK